jgi:transcriptional regulator with XRE-family HTH domain
VIKVKFDKEKFSKQLKFVTQNINISDYAEKCGISRSYLSQYIGKHRENPPKPEILKKIADASGGKLDYEELMVTVGYLDEKRYEERKNYLKIMRQYRESNNLPEGLKDELNQKEILPDYEELLPVYEFENRIIWEDQDERERKSNFRSHLKDYFAKKIAEKSDYAVKIKDDRFKDLGIHKNYLVAVKKCQPRSGKKVLIIIQNGEENINTIKRYYRLDNGKIHLDPSDNSESIYEESEIRVIGEIISIRGN